MVTASGSKTPGASVMVHTKMYVNRSKLYLAPVVNSFDSRLAGIINKTTPLAWGVNDLIYHQKKARLNHAIFILHNTIHMRDYMRYVKNKPYYVDDYIFHLGNLDIHMSVLRMTRPWRKTHQAFVNGKFSEMYDDRQLKRVGIRPRLANGKPNAIYQVLTKHPEYQATFEAKLEELYGTNTGAPDAEFDSFSFSNCYEVFNSNNPPGLNELLHD